MKIKVFGEKAKEMEDGQLFRVIKYSTEGRDVVELEPVYQINRDGETLPVFEVKYD